MFLCMGFSLPAYSQIFEMPEHRQQRAPNTSRSTNEIALGAMRESIRLEQLAEESPDHPLLASLIGVNEFERLSGSGKPLIVLISDTHGDLENTQTIFEQMRDYAELRGIREVFYIHLGDWTRGDSPEQLREIMQFFRENAGLDPNTELPQSHLIAGMGNMEDGGYYVTRRSTRLERQQASAEVIRELGNPIRAWDHETSALSERPAHDDELGLIELGGLRIASAHKPLLPLPRVSDGAERSLVPSVGRQINYRRLLPPPFTHIERDTRQTMRDDVIVPAQADLLVHAHTHLPHLSILWVRDESLQYRRMLVVNPGTSFIDPRVAGSRGTYASIDLNAQNPSVRAHSIEEAGRILAWQSIHESPHWGERPHEAKPGTPAGRCVALMKEAAEAPGFGQKYLAPVGEFIRHMAR